MKIKESDLVLTSLAGTRWTVEKPDKCTLSEWIEFGYKLRSASDEEILSLISCVVRYLEDKLNDETLPSTDDHREYVRGCANMTLNAARAEWAKRHSERLGWG
jgi:hypothetical protein